MFRNYLKLSLLVSLLAVVVFSCQKEDLDLEDIASSTALNWGDDGSYYSVTAERSLVEDAQSTVGGDRKPCFKPVYPLSFLFFDGSIEEVQNIDELKALIKAFRESRQDRNDHPTIVFPHEVELEDGSVVTVESKDDTKELLKECRNSIVDEKRCFKLVFPVSLVFPGGRTIEFADMASLKEAFKRFRRLHPRSRIHPQFAYPLTVEDMDGNAIVLQNARERKKLIRSCRPDRSPCFKWVFPITLEFPNGTMETINTADELEMTILEWKENNERTTERPHVQLPAVIELQNGNIRTINSPKELARATKMCRQKHRRNRGR